MICGNCGANVVNNTMSRCPYCGADLGRLTGSYANNAVYQQNTDSLRGKMIASMVLGISSVVFGWFNWVSILGLAAGIVGLVFGIQVRRSAPSGMPIGMATAGFICSIVGIALSGFAFLYLLL